MRSKPCTLCGKNQSLTEFYKDPNLKDGHKYRCKTCQRHLSREWSKNNKQKALHTARVGRYKRNYGLTLEEYDLMIRDQQGVCKICGGTNKNGYRLYVDHDHKTGEIRGLLCYSCNTNMGWYDAQRIKIEEYLNE